MKPAPLDSIPPPWKTASRLTLESQFVRTFLPDLNPAPAALQVQSDPRKLRVTVDPDSGLISTVSEVGEFPLGPGAAASLATYSRLSARETFQRQWVTSSQKSLTTLAGAQPAANRPSGLSFAFPSPLPSKIQSLLGPGGPALNVSGAENIKLSGTSSWTNQQTGLLGQRRSLFPALDMQQDLNIRLEGQLSDRVRVNLLQNSINPIPLTNRIAINYRGGEDDLVQEFDLGNTNLTLPNTQYVSYSGRNEGLFGAKSALRYGPLDFTVLTSKQEGRSERASYAGGASKQNRTIADMDYVRGVYFFLYDPSGFTQSIDEPSIRVFKDDYNYGNLSNKVRGRALVDPRVLNDPSRTDTASVRGSFSQLNPGPDKDYEILNDVYGPQFKVIKLHQQLTGEQRLAVTYRYHFVDQTGAATGPLLNMGGQDADTTFERAMKLLRPPASDLRADSLDPTVFDRDTVRAPFNVVRNLELKNFYDLAAQRIDPQTLKISIERGTQDPPAVTLTLADGTPVPYIEALGLDNLDETHGTPTPGHDQRVDGTLVLSNTRLFVDYENGTLFFPDLRPFAPRVTGPNAVPFDSAIAARLNRRVRLDGSLGDANQPNSNAYDKYNPQRSIDPRYYIDIEFTAQRAGGDVYLGRSNIVEGSDVVSINGQPLVRDRDYTIDYELGRVTLVRQLGPADNLNIDYSYAPLFAQAGRTLVGSAFKVQGLGRSVGGAFLYESKGAQDVRPRLGEEPSRSVLTDLNTAWDLKPDWMTRLVDRLPGIRTTTPSELHVQAEAGMSFPNPNTRNEVYVDDMEGVRDAVSLSMGPERWRWSSVPSLKDTLTGRARSVLEPGIVDTLKNTEVHWYSPLRAVKEKDLKPNLTLAQGAENFRQVLAISLPRRPKSAPNGEALWAGLTYPLDIAGLDVSRSQFIELWVNDWNDKPRVRDRHVRLHIDLGTVSEDQMRSPDVPPDTVLNSEDKVPRDNQLTVTDNNNEDTGYDGVLDAGENHPPYDLATASPGDPSGDDFHGPDDRLNEIDPRRYLYTNGTEGNKAVNPTPDTEDLNLNQILDTQEDYVEYTIDLGDTTYLVTDVQHEAQLGHYPGVAADNGWRRYRIPINDARAVRFGSPNLTLARHVRVWLQGVIDVDPQPVGETKLGDFVVTPFVVLGSLDIVGSRWQAVDLPRRMKNAGTTVTLNAVNNLDNADNYAPPFTPGQTRSGNQEVTRREQSIALEFTQLQAGDTLEAFKTFSIDEDYSRYGNLKWFTAAFDVPDHVPGDSLLYFVRFSSDEIESNYYEVTAPLPPSSAPGAPARLIWENAALKLTDISNLKLNPNYRDTDTVPYRYAVPNSSVQYAIKGRPSFTRLRRISIGLINRYQDPLRSYSRGQLWFDELRATDIAKDVDRAGRMMVNGNFANLMRYNVSLDGRGADFLTVGQSRGTGNSVRAVGVNTSIDLHRFFEGTGIVMPLTFNYADNSSKPRFTAGDDVVRSGVLSEASQTRAINRGWTTSYQRVWNDRSNPFLRFWLSGLTASMNGGQGSSSNPNAVGTNSNLGATVSYGITPRRYLPLRIPLTKLLLFPLPERAWWNYSLNTSQSHVVERLRDGTPGRTLTDVNGRSAGIDFGADTRPLDVLHHHIEAHRNLSLPDPLLERWGFINLGKVVSWRQSMDASYTFNRGNWVRPALSWNANYGQGNGPELSPDLSLRSIGNGQSLRVAWDLPFDRLAFRSGAPGDTSHAGGPGLWRRVLGRLGTVSADATFNQSSGYSRIVGTPSFVYLFGFSSDPGLLPDGTGRVASAFGNSSSKSEDWRATGRSKLTLLYGSSVSARGEFSGSHALNNGVVSRKAAQRFPSLEFEYGKVAHAILLDRILSNPQLRTSYDRARTIDYLNNSDSPSIISTSSDWRPLLGLTGDLKNGARTDLQLERRVTQDENHILGNSIKTTRNTNFRYSLSRSYSQGQKVNFLGKETLVRSTVSLGLTANYSRNSGETKIFNRDGTTSTQLPSLDDRLAVNGTGSYGFSNNVTGNVLLGFGQDRDLQRDIIRRNVIVELRASFTF